MKMGGRWFSLPLSVPPWPVLFSDQWGRFLHTHETCSYHLCHNHGMAVRTTIDIPEPLHDRLRDRAERSGTSIRSLIVHAIEQTYPGAAKGQPVTGPLIRVSGKRGPRYPTDENPHDFVFS
jgi:hypothetical protein